MQFHVHTGLEFVLLSGVSAILVIHMLRFLAAWLVTLNGLAGSLGRGIGGVVTF